MKTTTRKPTKRKGQKMDKEVNEAVAVAEPPKVRLCKLDEVLMPSVIAMLGTSPTNATVRALVLSAVKQPLPDDCVTFDQIKDWVEYNIKPQNIKPKVDLAAVAMRIAVHRTHTESGNARYTRNMSGSRMVTLTNTQLRDMANSCGDLEEFQDMVIGTLKDNVEEDWPDMDYCDDGSAYYQDHDGEGDITGVNIRIPSQEDVASQAVNLLKQNFPDVYSELE